MSEQEDQDRYRYLQLKMKMSQSNSQPQPSLIDRAKSMYSSYKQSPLYQASPQGMLENTDRMVDKGFNKMGEMAAEKMATTRNPVTKQPFSPNTSAAVGTTIQMLPLAAKSFAGMGAGKTAAEAGSFGMPGKIVSGPSRQIAGSMIGKSEEAVGVNTDVVPTLKDVSSNLGLKTANMKQYLNALIERLKSGEEMGPEALSQHHKMVTEILSKESSGIAAKLGIPSPRTIGSPAVAQATRINRMLVERLNEAAPGRELAASLYRAAMLRGKLYKTAAGVAAGSAATQFRNPLIKAFSNQ